MKLYEIIKNIDKYGKFVLICILIIFLLGCIFSGCANHKPISEIKYIDRLHIDTIQKIDSFSRYKYIYVKGDTIVIHDSIDRWRWRDRVIIQHQHDSIDKPIYIEKKLNAFQRFIQGSGFALWGIVFVVFIILIVKIAIKMRGL